MPDVFQAPGPELFELGPLIPGGPEWLTKPVLLALLGSTVVVGFCWAAFANPRMVPRGLQNLGEYAYVFVRDQIARPFLGKDAERWMGLLLSIFLLVLAWNLMGVVPLLQFPVASHIAFPAVLAITVYIIKIYLGAKHHGLRRYLADMLFPADLPKWAHGAYAPMMFAEFFITSLFTHAVRVFANMFAGHMLLAFFSSVGFWFLFERLTPLGVGLGVLGVLMTILMTAFELFIMALQAFLFAMLASMFIGSAISGEH
ncbi:F0F1 ATP synthase subunit A [Nonomuraea sp. NPDC050556]|uniref:F0F1 ATP synthase subunit A n=1 Tax=Nonomuraea sp. NPDC050556 TaxID=3364369 RepID=UPI00379EC1C6